MSIRATDPYDIFSMHAQRSPIVHEKMRNEDPVHRAEHPDTGQAFWFLTRYEDCRNFLKDKRFGKEFRRHLPAHPAVRWIAGDTETLINQHMLNLDDPAHARLKSLVHLAFTPLRIDNLRPRLQAIADGLFDVIDDEVNEGDDFNLTERYISQLPLLSIAAMLGIPADDLGSLFAWTQNMLLSDQDIGWGVAEEFSNYLDGQIDIRRRNPNGPDDLLMGFVLAEDAGDRLTREELIAMVFLLITAGYETMVTFIGNSVTTLMENRDQLHMMQANPGDEMMLKTAIEELLRYNGPSHMTLASWALEDVEIGGKVIRQGDIVHAVLHAANRDPLVFDEPHKLNILRQPNRHLAFSYGIHHCLGAALARLEGEIAIATLLRRALDL